MADEKPHNDMKRDVTRGLETLHALALGTVLKVQDDIEAEEYTRAMEAVGELRGHLTGLAFAEKQILAVGRGQIVLAEHIQAGHRLKDIGVVLEDAEPVKLPCPSGGHAHDAVKVVVLDGDGDREDVHFEPGTQVVVMAEDEHPATSD